MNKIAVFGSAFNPPSLGHQSVIESVSHFDLILLVPSIAHAWGKDMLDYSIRCSLVDEFIQDLELTNIKRSMVEEELYQPGSPVTTYQVLDELSKTYPDSELTFIVGPDNFFSFERFYKAKEIMTRFSVLACPERVSVRSSDIRAKLLDGRSIESLTTPSVVKKINALGLYTDS
ncbi:nicotinate-nicotinamide nucleotide adenylyltransferase [Vibrio sp.]|nr:nicotinate-nicotinamide nucleotide adenylyltransferase [Vibrio sp.]